MTSHPSSYLNPALRAVHTGVGRAVVARTFIPRHAVLAAWGGTIYGMHDFFDLPDPRRQISVQIDEDLFLVPEVEGPAEWFNHACDPNAGLFGQIGLQAMRDIHPGEEVRYDYAMSDGCRYDEFECGCGSANCRRRITGNDWRIEELWDRYAGYFSPYLQRRIDAMRRPIGDGLVRDADLQFRPMAL